MNTIRFIRCIAVMQYVIDSEDWKINCQKKSDV